MNTNPLTMSNHEFQSPDHGLLCALCGESITHGNHPSTARFRAIPVCGGFICADHEFAGWSAIYAGQSDAEEIARQMNHDPDPVVLAQFHSNARCS